MKELKDKAKKIKLLITDCDGVLTDTGVYYSAEGEAMKRFSIRDGMGVERLRNLCNIDTGIMTGENSEVVRRRSEKLKMTHYYAGVKNKKERLEEILSLHALLPEQIAYIGDDVNDLEIIGMVGLSASPSDAMEVVKKAANYICKLPGGNGAFREFAELIIELNQEE